VILRFYPDDTQAGICGCWSVSACVQGTALGCELGTELVAKAHASDQRMTRVPSKSTFCNYYVFGVLEVVFVTFLVCLRFEVGEVKPHPTTVLHSSMSLSKE
jgi:hypothetical protein